MQLLLPGWRYAVCDLLTKGKSTRLGRRAWAGQCPLVGSVRVRREVGAGRPLGSWPGNKILVLRCMTLLLNFTRYSASCLGLFVAANAEGTHIYAC